MALTNKTFSDLITFTRSGTATRVNSAGLVEDVAADTPRFDHDPVTGALKGLLIEESRTNLLTDNADFTQSAWVENTATVTPNQAAAPDGTATMDLITPSSSVSGAVYQSVTLSTSTTYRLSIFAKAGTSTQSRLTLYDVTGGDQQGQLIINWTAGVPSTSSLVGSAADESYEDFGGGIYRISVSMTSDATNTSHRFYWYPDHSAGTGTTYLWGAQLEAGSFATSYIPTPSSFTSRASTATYFDSAGVMQTAAVDEARTGYKLINGTWTSMGLLLEAAGTNLMLRSEEFDNASWTKTQSSTSADAIAAPDGATTADKLIEDSATSEHYAQQTVSSLTGDYTFSVYAKAAEKRYLGIREASVTADRALFDLQNGVVTATSGSPTATIQDVGGGWYRCTLTPDTSYSAQNFTPRLYLTDDSGGIDANSYTGDGASGLYLWGAQLEANAYATSYIPTTTTSVTRSADVSSSSTVTRNADNASITGTAFSDWFNASEGTVFVEASGNDTNNANSVAWCISDGDNNDRIQSVLGTTSHLFVADAGVTQVNLDAGGFSNGVAGKMAAAFKVNDFAACIDGGAVATDTGGTIPTVDRMTIGANAAGNGAYLNGHIKNIKFYPSRLTDAELQALTT